MKLGKLLALRRNDGRAEEFSDEALVAACALGDSAATGALIDRFQRPLYRFVSRLLGSDGSDRDDLVQATFIEVTLSAARYKGTAAVKVWIFGIAANLARNHIRSAVQRRKLESALTAVPQHPVSRPDALAEHHELIEQLAVALAALPHHLREAFVLCDIEHVPCREAADALGVREGTIWSRVHEARRSLRESLTGGGE